MSNVLMGVDVGTSSTKTVLIDLQGRQLGWAAHEYDIDTPRPGWAEQDPETWCQAAVVTMRQALVSANIPPQQVQAIGLSGQMHGTVCVDGLGQPLRPAIIWADQRSRNQVARLREKLGRDQLGVWTANPLATGFMLASWQWLCDEQPEVCHATERLLLPKDYVRYRLTGEFGSEPSDASSTLLFDTARRRWSEELLGALGMDGRVLPSVHESTEIAGGLGADVASATGLRPGTPVVFGGSDQACQALGHGVVEPGVVSCTIGTGGQLFAPARTPTYDRLTRLHLFCHAMPDRWHLMAAILSAGLSLKWLRDAVLAGDTYQAMADAATQVRPGSDGLFFLPYLAGERTPHMDPDAAGGWFGLTLRHGRDHLIRAVMEGVVFALRQGLGLMLDLGVRAERVVASGGGTRHPLWLQLQADIFNRPIFRTRTVEAAAKGAAVLAGVGVGVFSDVPAACRQTVRWRDEVVEPVPVTAGRYNEAYRFFCQLYPALSVLKRDGEILHPRETDRDQEDFHANTSGARDDGGQPPGPRSLAN